VSGEPQRKIIIIIIVVALFLSIFVSLLIYTLVFKKEIANPSSSKQKDTSDNSLVEELTLPTTTDSGLTSKAATDSLEDLSQSWKNFTNQLQHFETEQQTTMQQLFQKLQVSSASSAQTETAPTTDSNSTMRSQAVSTATGQQFLSSTGISNKTTATTWSSVYTVMQHLTDSHQNSIEQFLQLLETPTEN